MKYIPNITGMQTKIVKSARYVKKPTSLTYFRRSVLAKLKLEKKTYKFNDGHYKKVVDKLNG